MPIKVLQFLILALAGSMGCFAQTVGFGVSSGSASPGATVTLDLSMDTSSGPAPSSVQWTLTYPATDFSSAAVTPAAAALGAGKSLSCTSVAGSSTCVLWGENNTAVTNGDVASIALVISPSTQDTTSQVQISVPMAADSSGFPLMTAATGGTVTIIQPPTLSGFSCLPTTVIYPATAACSLELSADALTGGASISLTASPTDVTLPATVVIPAGSSSGIFTVTPLSVTSPTAVTLTASYLNSSEGFGLTIDPAPVVLTGISASPAVLVGGQTASGLITLSSPAGNGGAVVALSSSNTSVATVPASVTVSQGSTTASFNVQSVSVSAKTSVVITGSYASVNLPANLTVIPILSGISVNPNAVVGPTSATGTVTLASPAGGGGAIVNLTSSNVLLAGVPASVTVPQGSTTASFTVTTLSVLTTSLATLSASYSGATVTTALTINPRPHPLASITLNPTTIQSGQKATGTVTLGGPAGAGGVVINLASSNTSAVSVPSTVTVAQGTTTASFTATASSVKTTTTVAILAYHAGIQVSANLTVK
jgi:hypothetical protein